MDLQAAIILYFIIVFLTFIHELGHFLMARICNEPVAYFAIGFGPSLYSFKDKKGTVWRINIIPLGGYVEMSENGNETDAMLEMSPIKNILVTLGGPLINILFFLFGGILFYNHYGIDVNTYKINNTSYYIRNFNKELPPENHFIIKENSSNKVTYNLKNNSNEFQELLKHEINQNIINNMPLNIKDSFNLCIFTTKSVISQAVNIITSITELKKIKSIIMAQKQIKNMLNKSETFKEILKNIIFYLLIMSLQLGILNLLPIVGLDGFWILFSIINLIFRFRLSNQRKLITIINYGTYLLFISMGLIFFRDLYELFKEFLL